MHLAALAVQLLAAPPYRGTTQLRPLASGAAVGSFGTFLLNAAADLWATPLPLPADLHPLYTDPEVESEAAALIANIKESVRLDYIVCVLLGYFLSPIVDTLYLAKQGWNQLVANISQKLLRRRYRRHQLDD